MDAGKLSGAAESSEDFVKEWSQRFGLRMLGNDVALAVERECVFDKGAETFDGGGMLWQEGSGPVDAGEVEDAGRAAG